MFREGEEFASYAELRDKISEFERTEFVQLNVQRSKSIEAARRRTPTKNYKDDLIDQLDPVNSSATFSTAHRHQLESFKIS